MINDIQISVYIQCMSATKPTRLATKRSILRRCWPFPLDMGPVVRKLKYELNKRIRVNCFIRVRDRILVTVPCLRHLFQQEPQERISDPLLNWPRLLLIQHYVPALHPWMKFEITCNIEYFKLSYCMATFNVILQAVQISLPSENTKTILESYMYMTFSHCTADHIILQ